jgi:sugar/nucleoside kinase (ribokinase family)
VRPLGVIGNLALDFVEGSPPRVGGGPYHAARALQAMRWPSIVVAKCGAAHRDELLPPLVALGLPVRCLVARATATFAMRYDGDHREMRLEALGDPWRPEHVAGLRADGVHVAALVRSHFPPETLAELARGGRRVLLDGQGLVRRPETGPLQLDADYDPELLRHISILKLSEEEADVVGDPETLDVAEVVLTQGPRGSTIFCDGRCERVPAHPIDAADPTGAGDGFAAVYLVARCDGHSPVAAARRATAVVATLLR